jgi:DNA-directed RNA polymerase subunit RPC12/RpoP
MLANADGGLEKETLVSRLRAAQGRFGAKARREMADWLAALGIGGKVSTPRSEVPMPALKSAPRKASLLSRRRMLFSCPACLRDVVTPRNMSGRRMRCPQCGSALLAPHPHKSGMAWNRESHLESLLHPELYAQPGPPRPRVLGIPVPKVQNALLACALLILVAAAWRLTHFSPRDALRSLAGGGGASDGGQQHPAAADLETSALQAKAEQTVRDFLQADGWEKKSEFVRDAIRVKALMRDFYGRCGGDEASAVDRVTAGPPGYYAMENLPQPTNLVAAVLGGGRQHMFRVEHLPEGARIEWESSVCYSPMPWEQVLCCSADSGPHLLRVAASPDSYYNHGFSEEEFLSVRLHDPATGESLGNGYIPRKSEDAGRLAVFLNGASPQRPELLMLEVRPVAKSDIHRQVQIVRFIKGGFRSPEAPVMAAANTGDPD